MAIGGFLLRINRIEREANNSSPSNPPSRTMALGSNQPLIEMNTKNLPEANGRPACKADNLTAICGPIV
jgi:hypothetical protein